MNSIFTKLSIFTICLGMLFSSCESVQNANSTQKGAAVGVAAGAVLGAVLGNNLGDKNNSELGAVLGAVVGGAAGGIIGNKMDKQAAAIETALPGAEVERVGEGIRVVLGENSVNFDFGKASLTSLAQTNLDKLIPAINAEENTDLKILGYTDSKGSDEYNLNLSKQRAQAVYSYLTSHGVASSRLTVSGKGEVDPIADNETEAGRAQNRRVEFIITANDEMLEEAQQQAGN